MCCIIGGAAPQCSKFQFIMKDWGITRWSLEVLKPPPSPNYIAPLALINQSHIAHFFSFLEHRAEKVSKCSTTSPLGLLGTNV